MHIASPCRPFTYLLRDHPDHLRWNRMYWKVSAIYISFLMVPPWRTLPRIQGFDKGQALAPDTLALFTPLIDPDPIFGTNKFKSISLSFQSTNFIKLKILIGGGEKSLFSFAFFSLATLPSKPFSQNYSNQVRRI